MARICVHQFTTSWFKRVDFHKFFRICLKVGQGCFVRKMTLKTNVTNHVMSLPQKNYRLSFLSLAKTHFGLYLWSIPFSLQRPWWQLTHITTDSGGTDKSAICNPCTRNSARASPLSLGLDRPSFSILRNTNKKVRSRRPSFRAVNTKVTQTSAREALDNAGKAEQCTPRAALCNNFARKHAMCVERFGR